MGDWACGARRVTAGEVKVERALEVFNAGEHPRRVAGSPARWESRRAVRPLAEAGGVVSIAIIWELCWYRYEVDLGDEAAGAKVVAQGTELGELDPGGPARECRRRRARALALSSV